MSETDPTKQPGDEASSGGGERGEGNAPIPLEPDAEEPSRTPGAPPARIDAPGLLEEFDEDADFERDPEVERVVRGIPVKPKASPPRRASKPTAEVEAEAEVGGDPISAPGSWRIPAAIGGAAIVTAVVFAGINADHSHWAYVLRTIYWAGLHTATGVGAVVAASLLLGRPVGRFDSAAARMFLAVSLFLVTFSLDIPIPSRIDEVVLGAGAYFGAILVGFRLPPRDAAVIGGAHFGLALLVELGSMLTGVIERGGAALGTGA